MELEFNREQFLLNAADTSWADPEDCPPLDPRTTRLSADDQTTLCGAIGDILGAADAPQPYTVTGLPSDAHDVWTTVGMYPVYSDDATMEGFSAVLWVNWKTGQTSHHIKIQTVPEYLDTPAGDDYLSQLAATLDNLIAELNDELRSAQTAWATVLAA